LRGGRIGAVCSGVLYGHGGHLERRWAGDATIWRAASCTKVSGACDGRARPEPDKRMAWGNSIVASILCCGYPRGNLLIRKCSSSSITS
ncbi:hypothetical protein CYMTET_50904, partial [Cymbomonas tetramitiformis]